MEGTNCSERALLPEKSMREKLSQLIEDDFSKVTLVNTLKYFKQKSGKNECVDATIKILEHIKKENEVPKLYKTLLREIRKDSPISSWLPSYSSSPVEIYPNMPEHTIENEYIADMERREIKLKTQAAQKYTIPRCFPVMPELGWVEVRQTFGDFRQQSNFFHHAERMVIRN